MRRRRAAEVEDLLLCLRWADLHASDPRLDPEHRRADGSPAMFHPIGGDRLVDVGGEDTPQVRELSLCELAIAREVHVLSVRSTLADALDLRHRLPQTWAVVLSLACEPWLARRAAAMSRVLPSARVGLVDRAVAAAIAGHAPSRVLALTEAKIIEADPAGHAERVRAERERRYVTLTRRDTTGLRGIVARVEEGDAEWFAATLERVTDILADQPHHTTAQTPKDHLRAEALGWLARPADLLRLLLQHADEDQPTAAEDSETAANESSEPGPADLDRFRWPDPEDPDTADPDAEPEPGEPDGPDPFELGDPYADPTLTKPTHPERAWTLHPAARAADTLAALDRLDLTVLRPRGVLYVHLDAESFHAWARTGGTHPADQRGVARAEGLGPVTLDRLADLLGHHGQADLRITPVIDLADHLDTSAYEHTQAQTERIHLIHPGDAFPHASGTSRSPGRIDLDHPQAWDPLGPPGQTSTRTSQPLGRTAHRAKTHRGYTSRPLRPGVTRWHTPHGLTRIVDGEGTHHLDE